MELSERLTCVVSMVSKGNVVADIGCDHGYAAIWLIENQISPRVIALDVNQGPLEQARKHIMSANLLAYIDIRLSDGAQMLKQEDHVDTILCAGMGARLMSRILSEGVERLGMFPELILQPQSEIGEFRRFLKQIGYQIEREKMIYEDGKFYPVLCAIQGCTKGRGTHENETDRENEYLYEEFGPVLLREKNEVLKRFLIQERDKYETLLSMIRKEQNQYNAAAKRLNDIRQALLLYDK